MEIRDVIDRINDDIVEIISNYVELSKSGSNHKGSCPFHNEKTASFMVSPHKGIFKCFGCGKGGDAVNFIMEYNSVEFREAVTIGAKKLNIDFEWKDYSKQSEEERLYTEMLHLCAEKAAEFFETRLTKNLVSSKHLKKRGFSINNEDVFRVGYAPPENELLKWAHENNINKSGLYEIGLLKLDKEKNRYYDFFRDRLMFPICSKTGKVIGFTGRALTINKEVPKYINSPESKLFNKGHELYGLNIARHAIRRENRAYLVEGTFDVMRMHKIGAVNTVAPCGTAFTIDQARLLKAYTKNVTLIYDGDEAGRKAVDRNGELLVKEQFNVMVIMLPDGEDPDSFFRKPEKFEEYKYGHQKDFIIHLAETGEKSCSNPAYKFEFIKKISALIAGYDEPALHEVYLDRVSGIIKPKKAWIDAIRQFVADKGTVEKKVYIPKTVSADEFLELGFYDENSCYFFADKKGIPKQRSNFVLSPLFHIESTINAKRLYEVHNVKGLTRVVEIPQRDMVSLSAFQIHMESLGNFWWDGSQSDLNRLKRWLYEKTESCREITQLGWQKEGFYCWGNGIFNGDFTPVDSYGIVKHEKRSYYVPAFSAIYEKEENLYQFERKFIHMEGNITLKEYARKFTSVFGENAKIALCFYFASLFRDIIVRRFGIFPILNMFGPKGAGKTACAESLVQFFGRLMKAPNLHNTSKPALADHVATSCNAICHLDEYRNDLDMEKREFLKGLWDGTGRTRMNMDKDKKKETTSVDQGVIITGQQMATADIALMSRFIFMSFTQTEYNDNEREEFMSLKEIEKRGLTHITHQLLRLRDIFRDNFGAHVKFVSERMRGFMNNTVVEDRIFNNWLIPLASFSTLAEHIELPWDEHETVKLGVRLMLSQNAETKKNDDLGNFWKVVEYLISSNLLFDRGDYKVVFSNKIKRRYIENGRWMSHEEERPEAVKLLYLTKARVFSLYKSQSLREGDKPLPESTIEYYLKNSPAFICETAKESFKKIDAKTGIQEIDLDTNEKKWTSTTALVFDMAKLSLNVWGENSETENFSTDNSEITKSSDAVQGDLPFTPRTPQKGENF